MRGNLDRSGPPERRSRQYAQALRDLGIQLTSIIRDYMEPCLKDLPLFEGMENGSEQVEKRIGVLYRFSQRALDDESEGYRHGTGTTFVYACYGDCAWRRWGVG